MSHCSITGHDLGTGVLLLAEHRENDSLTEELVEPVDSCSSNRGILRSLHAPVAQPVQKWVWTGGTDSEAVLCIPPDVNNILGSVHEYIIFSNTNADEYMIFS